MLLLSCQRKSSSQLHAHTKNPLYFFSNIGVLFVCLFPPCVLALAKISRTELSRSGESGRHYRVFGLRRISFCLLALRVI